MAAGFALPKQSFQTARLLAPRGARDLPATVRDFDYTRLQEGHDYLELLRFYLNHTPFMCSETHRAHQSPAELLTGKSHPHWLEMLGYQKFKRAA